MSPPFSLFWENFLIVVLHIPQRCACFSGCHPLILDDNIVFPTTPVVCLSRDDYTTLWDLETILGPLYPKFAEVWNIAASVNQVYIVLEGEDERKVLAVDEDTGAVIWMKDLIATGVAAEGEVVYFVGEDLYALDAKTGEFLWVFNLGFSWSNIAVGPQTVYVIDDQNYLYAVNKYTGNLTWKSPWQESEWVDYIVIAGDTIICSNILNLSAFSAENGKEMWKLHFQDYPIPSAEKPCPALAEGILIISIKEIQREDTFTIIKPEKLVALASDPDIFVKQGDSFLSKNMKEEAINSYRKAQELSEKEGNETQFRKIQEQIAELENLQETTPPETTPPESQNPPGSSSPPSSTPSSPKSPPLPIFVLGFLVLIGVFILYYLIKRGKA
jgi:outer membrane protein assembly factor BamB